MKQICSNLPTKKNNDPEPGDRSGLNQSDIDWLDQNEDLVDAS